MGNPFTTGWYDRIEALIALALARSSGATSGTSDPWVDVAAGTTLSPTAAQRYLSCDATGAQTTINLLSNPTSGQIQVVRLTGTTRVTPVIVRAQGAGITVEDTAQAPGTFGASTWLALQEQIAAWKFDGVARSWKLYSLSQNIGAAAADAGNWEVDPQGTSGGLDTNSGAPGSPLRTYREWMRRQAGRLGSSLAFGSVAPVIKFLSSHTDNSDPVTLDIFTPAAITPQITAADGPVVAAVLAGVTAKNRTAGANSPLIATLPAGTLVGDLVVNTTAGKSSRAYVLVDRGGGSFELGQPCAPQAVPSVSPVEVNSWANLDTVNVIRQLQVNIVQCSSIIGEPNGGFTNQLYLSNLQVFDPLGPGNSNFCLGTGVVLLECVVQRFGSTDGTGGLGGGNQVVTFNNCCHRGGINVVGVEYAFLAGGMVAGTSFTFSSLFVDADFVIVSPWNVTECVLSTGFVFMGGNINFSGGQLFCSTGAYGGHVIYGAAAPELRLAGRARAVMVSGTYAAGWTAPTLVTGVRINGATTAQTHTNASPDVVTSNVATSVANADAANGGNMESWGGASISKAA